MLVFGNPMIPVPGENGRGVVGEHRVGGRAVVRARRGGGGGGGRAAASTACSFGPRAGNLAEIAHKRENSNGERAARVGFGRQGGLARSGDNPGRDRRGT